jgi:hypothetical protein
MVRDTSVALSIVAFLCALTSSPAVIGATSQRQQIRLQQTPEEITHVRRVADSKGLKAAAAVFGHFVQ